MRVSALLFLALVAAASAQAVQWHTKNVVKTVEAKLNHAEADQWIRADAKEDGLHIELPENGYSYVQLTDRFDYSDKGVLQVKLDQIKGSFSVQAVCYDDEGKVFTYVDLLEYLESPGTFEVPLKIFRTPLKGTKKIAFKIWLAGDHPTATVESVAYGMTQ